MWLYRELHKKQNKWLQRLSHTTASDSKGKLCGPICYLCQDNVANCILQKWYRRFLSQQEFSLSLLRTKNVCNSLFSVSISHRKPLSSPSFQHKSLELFRKVKLNSAFSLSQKRCSQNAEMIHQYRQDYNTQELLLSRCLYKTILSFMTCPGYTETNTWKQPTKLVALRAASNWKGTGK